MSRELRRIVFDIEANGLDTENLDKVHCVVAQEIGGARETAIFGPGETEDAARYLSNPSFMLIGHNIVEYDIPVLRRWGLRVGAGRVFDTRFASRAIYPGRTLHQKDFGFRKREPEFPGNLIGSHALGAWGWRLKNHKGDYEGGFEEYNDEMLEYCIQDVALTGELYEFLLKRGTPEHVLLQESEVAAILREQRLHGVAFDVDRAVALMSDLVQRRDELTEELRQFFPDWYVAQSHTVPKRNMMSRQLKPGEEGYRNVAEGCAYTKVKLTTFNPSSDLHIADRLQKVYGWKPQHFTDDGRVSTKEEILVDLTYPPVALLVEYQQVQKTLGFIAEGQQAWLKLEKDGRLHGTVHATGTVTTRMSHFRPNTGQVPSRGRGAVCRELFVPSDGLVLVGCDASGLQLRVLAHYLARYDEGAFAQAVLDDPHTYMQAGTGIYLRQNQKTWTYAKLFGAGNYKLGTIIRDDMIEASEQGLYEGQIPTLQQAARLGKRSQTKLAQYMKGLHRLERQLEATADRGWLNAVDGRRVPVLSKHRALNTLLMAGEACIMKRGLLIANEAFEVEQLPAHFVLNVHDEWQVETEEKYAELVGGFMQGAIKAAGEALKLRVQLDADYRVGKHWGETH
jgi:DNA polymerase I-like protein with 3'-5' exonuclease and polymerase domains